MGKIYTQLSLEERTIIHTQHGLNRSASTLSRELRRNGWGCPTTRRGPGRPGIALWDQVMRYRKTGDSLEQIAGTLALVLADSASLQVSHETIYTALYAIPRDKLLTDVIGWLCFGHAKRGPRVRENDRLERTPDMVSIA